MKLFFLVSRVPFPLEKGDKLRAYHQLRLLNKEHDIHLCCLNFGKLHPDTAVRLKEICSSYSIVQLTYLLLPVSFIWSLLSGNPFQVGFFWQPQAIKKVKSIISTFKPQHIYCQLIRTAEYVRNDSSCKKTIDFQDCFSAGTARREARSSWLTKWFWASEKRRLIAFENAMFNDFNHQTIISNQDKLAIQHPFKNNITIVPNGVDLSKFIPLHCPRTTDLLFTGNMGYPPNVESVLFLVNEILPLVKKEIPTIKLTICGASPALAVRKLASANIQVTGWVPDIVAVYHSTKIFIAPMQMGAGLQNKLLEAMACGIPCITSQLAANALVEENYDSFLVGVKPEEYAKYVVELIKDGEYREKLAQKGRQFVLDHYSWSQAVKPLADLLEN